MTPPNPKETDEILANRVAQRGATAASAFACLMQRYSIRLLRFLRTRGVPASDLDDLAQETWLRVWRSLPTWKAEHFRGWLFRIARNLAEDARKRRGTADAARGIRVETTAPDHSADNADDVKKLAGCLDRLPDEFRAVFEGHVAGERYEQMAERLRVAIGTIKSRLARARQELQTCMGTER